MPEPREPGSLPARSDGAVPDASAASTVEHVFEVYQVADRTVDGVRVQVEYQPQPCLSLASAGMPVLRTLVVHNETGGVLERISVEGRFAFGQSAEAVFSTTVEGPHQPSSAVDIPLATVIAQATVAAFQDSSEAASGSIQLRVAAERVPSGQTPVEVTIDQPVHVLAGNEFLNWPALHAALATFPRPNTRALTPILRAASDLLLKRTGSGALEGYQSGTARAGRIAGALYEALRGRGITYINPPASFEYTGQKVRTVDQVLADRFGTCIDLATLYAAALEASGLHPVMFVTNGHAFAGYFPDGQTLEQSVLHDPNTIANLVESGGVIPVELTGISPGADVKFRKAVELGRDYIHAQFDRVRSLIDLTRCRLIGIRPLPSLAFERPAGTDTVEATADERPFVAKGSLKGLTLDEHDEHVVGTLDLRDPAPARIQRWKRDLLDLSMRNPLLNLPTRGKVLNLLTPHGLLADVDDAVHAGRRIGLLPLDGVDEFARQRGIRAASELAAEDIARVFKLNRTLFGMVDGSAFIRRLRTLQRDARTLEQETGSNYLFLTLGALVHPKKGSGGSEARAPLFIIPVRLQGNPVLGFSIEAEDDERAVPNLCLIEWLRAVQGVRLPALEDPATDESGIAMTTVLEQLRAQLVQNRLPYRIDESVSLALLRFSTFQIWRDLDANWEQLMQAPIVEHLVRRPGETFADPNAANPAPIDETDRRLPIAADGSQLAAIMSVRAGHSFVLEGPPGTGKSQTITNLIAGLLHDGRTVLFVAEKQAALEVVKRRLDAIGVGGFALQLHGAKQSIGSIRQQLKAAFDIPVPAVSPTLAADSSRLAGVIGELQHYPERVHSQNASGLSLWSAYEQASALGDGPAADVPPQLLRDQGALAQQAQDAAETFTRLATQTGLTRGEPWSLVGSGFAPEAAGRTAAELIAVADRLAADLRGLDALPHGLRDLIAALDPGEPLAAAAYLVYRHGLGLAAAEALARPAPPNRYERLNAMRSRVADVVRMHAAVIAVARAELFTAPDLGALQTQAHHLDEVNFFRESRRRGLRSRLGELTSPEWATRLPGEQLSGFLDRSVAAAAAVTELGRSLSAIPELRLPPGWTPWATDAVPQFDEAVSTIGAADRIGTIVGGPGISGLLSHSPEELAWITELAAAWRDWLQALGADATSTAAWQRSFANEGRGEEGAGTRRRRRERTRDASGEGNWVSAWRRSQERWQRDLAVEGTTRIQRVSACAVPVAHLAQAGLGRFAVDLQSGAIPAAEAVPALMRGIARTALQERIDAHQFRGFDRVHEDELAASYRRLSSTTRNDFARDLVAGLLARRPFDPQNLRGEVAELRRQIDRKRGGLSFRELTRRYRDAIQSLTPCLLMSPGSVAHYLPADFRFDVVVFDEASQIRVSQAIGALGRARSAVIAGDSKQMPPTRYMEVQVSDDDAVPSAASGGDGRDSEGTPVVEDMESILEEAVESQLPRKWLTWHYRSQDERLIAFSNRAYYDGRLVTLPSPRIEPGDSAPESAPLPAGGPQETGLEWRRVQGVFDRGGSRTNETEAVAIVAAVSQRLADPRTRGDSIGIVTFNIQQRDRILDLLEDSDDLQIRAAMQRPAGEEIFVKNLENVQGDERDVIYFSLAFSRDPASGRLPLQFGPLTAQGGERRLNVAITRARKRIVLFSSFEPSDLDLSRTHSKGVADLRAYLEFAAGKPLPPEDGAEPEGPRQASGGIAAASPASRSAFVTEVREELERRGYQVAEAVGLSKFRVDLAVRRPEDEKGWRVAVLVDGPAWAAMPTVADREGAPGLLRTIMHWPAVERLWLPAWIANRSDCIDYLVTVIEDAAPFDVALVGEPGVSAASEPLAGTDSGAGFGGDAAASAPEAPAAVSAVVPPARSAAGAATPDVTPTPVADVVAAVPAPVADRSVPGAVRGGQADVARRIASGVTFTRFEPASSDAVARVAVLDNPRLAGVAIGRYAGEVLATEGPTHVGRLVRLVAARFGLHRVSERRRLDILRVIVRSYTATEDGLFIWPARTDPNVWRTVARTDPERIRSIAEISLHELVNGMTILLREALSMDRDELYSETIRAFGYGRVTASVRQRLENAVRLGLEQGRLRESGGRLRLVE